MKTTIARSHESPLVERKINSSIEFKLFLYKIVAEFLVKKYQHAFFV